MLNVYFQCFAAMHIDFECSTKCYLVVLTNSKLIQASKNGENMTKRQELNDCYYQCPELSFYDFEDNDLSDYIESNSVFIKTDDMEFQAHDTLLHVLIIILSLIGSISAICGFVLLYFLRK